MIFQPWLMTPEGICLFPEFPKPSRAPKIIFSEMTLKFSHRKTSQGQLSAGGTSVLMPSLAKTICFNTRFRTLPTRSSRLARSQRHGYEQHGNVADLDCSWQIIRPPGPMYMIYIYIHIMCIYIYKHILTYIYIYIVVLLDQCIHNMDHYCESHHWPYHQSWISFNMAGCKS